MGEGGGLRAQVGGARWRRHKVRLVRRTLADVAARGQLDPSTRQLHMCALAWCLLRARALRVSPPGGVQ